MQQLLSLPLKEIKILMCVNELLEA